MKRIGTLLGLALLVFALGCGSSSNPGAPDTQGASWEAQAGDEALANGDVAAANQHYRNALAKDPDHPQANVGAAVTELFLLQTDPEVDSLAGGVSWGSPLRAGGRLTPQAMRASFARRLGYRDPSFGPLATGRLVGRALLRGASDPPALSRVQHLIKTKLMPKLQYAEERLNRVEARPDWRFLVPPAITSEPDTFEIDLGEIYVLDAVINGIQGWLGVLVAYDFDAPADADAESLLAAGTDFGTLWPDGAFQLGRARDNFLVSKIRLEAAITFIENETDDQSDDVIPRAALEEQGFIEFMEGFDQAHASLIVPVDVEARTHDGQPITVSLLLKNFFTDPIDDWKTKLPAHSFDAQGEMVVSDPVTFPDPTFNGVFPGMTNDTWRALIGPVGSPPPPLRASRH